MHLDTDATGDFFECIQCGYVDYVKVGLSQEEAVAEGNHRYSGVGIRGPHRKSV